MNAPSDRAGQSVPLTCQLCGTRVYVSAQFIGKAVKCPDCHSANIVKEPPSKPPPASVLVDDGDEYRLMDDGQQPASATSGNGGKPKVVPVHCGLCSTLMYARIEHVGKKIRCPDCGETTVVTPPRAKTADRFEMADSSDVHVEKAPPPRVDEDKKELADKLMADATAHVDAKDAEQPRPPKRPLVDGIYTFPFYLNVLGIWILAGFGLVINLALLVTLIDLMETGGIGAIVCAFLAPLLAICVFGLLGLITPHLLTIIEYTAEGYDKVPHWPSQDLLTRIGSVLVWVNAAAMATAPGVLLATGIRALGVPLPVGVGLIPVPFLLPPILLSMLYNDSMFLPYSPVVFKSFKTVGRSWGMVWLQLIGVGVAIAALYWIVTQQAPTAADIVLVFAVSIYAVFLSRLIGRIGWILSQHADVDDEDDSIDEDDSLDQEMGEHEVFA